MDVDGFMGPVETARSADEACIVEKVIWTTQCWEDEVHPGIGDSITLGGSPSWWVTSSTRAGCALVLELCRAIIPCPDCLATVYSLERTPADGESCEELLDPVQIASEVPATVCPLDAQADNWGDAEINRRLVLICLEDISDISPQMVISCGSNNYRVLRVRQKCSGACLTTVEAELDTLGLLDS